MTALLCALALAQTAALNPTSAGRPGDDRGEAVPTAPAPPDPDAGEAAARELLQRLDEMKGELRNRPKTAEIEFALGNLYYESARWPEAIDAYRQLLERAAPALAAFRALRDRPAGLRAAKPSGAGAEACGGPADRQSFDSLVAAAGRFARAGAPADALACYRVALLPLGLAFSRMGNGWYLIGNEDKAIEAQRQGLALNPEDPEALFYLGAILFEGAEGDVPRLAEAKQLWLHFLRVANDPDRKKLVARDLLRIQAGIDNRGRVPPEPPPALRAMAVGPIQPPGDPPDLDDAARAQLSAAVQRGNVALAQKRWPQALAAFDAARAIDPGDPEAARGSGLALLNLGKLLAAEAALRDGLGRTPEDPRALVTLGEVYFKQQHYAGAARLWQQARDLDAQVAAAAHLDERIQAALEAK